MRSLLLIAMLAQIVFPPGKPPKHIYPPGHDGQSTVSAACPLTEAYLDAKFIDFNCGGGFTFIVCDPKPVFTLYEFCFGMVNMGSVTVNFTTKNVIDNTKDLQQGGFLNDIYPASTASLDACYAILEPHCPA